jgi:hypothetical protein
MPPITDCRPGLLAGVTLWPGSYSARWPRELQRSQVLIIHPPYRLFLITLAFCRSVMSLPGRRFTASSYALDAVEKSDTSAITSST